MKNVRNYSYEYIVIRIGSLKAELLKLYFGNDPPTPRQDVDGGYFLKSVTAAFQFLKAYSSSISVLGLGTVGRSVYVCLPLVSSWDVIVSTSQSFDGSLWFWRYKHTQIILM